MESVAKKETVKAGGLKSNLLFCTDCKKGKYLFTSYSLKYLLVG